MAAVWVMEKTEAFQRPEPRAQEEDKEDHGTVVERVVRLLQGWTKRREQIVHSTTGWNEDDEQYKCSLARETWPTTLTRHVRDIFVIPVAKGRK